MLPQTVASRQPKGIYVAVRGCSSVPVDIACCGNWRTIVLTAYSRKAFLTPYCQFSNSVLLLSYTYSQIMLLKISIFCQLSC